MDECKDIQKELALQMAVKAVNDTAGPDRLVPTLLVYRAYPRISNLDPPALSMERAAAIRKAMAEMVKLQVTERVKRIGDKENGTNESVNRGTALCRYMTATYHHVMAIYRHLLFFPVSGTRLIEHLRFTYGPSEGRTVHLRPIGRPYGLSYGL